eukprot:3139128-Prymnesium_polylepis.1
MMLDGTTARENSDISSQQRTLRRGDVAAARRAPRAVARRLRLRRVVEEGDDAVLAARVEALVVGDGRADDAPRAARREAQRVRRVRAERAQ